MHSGQTSLPRFYSKPLKAVTGPHDSEMTPTKADVSEITTMLNFTGMDIYRVDRVYPPFLLPARTHPSKRSVLVIRKEIHISQQTKQALRIHISREGTSRDAATQAFYDLFNERYTSSYGGMSLQFDYEITNRELETHDGAFVHMETGYLLTTRSNNIPAHPFSHDSLLADMWPHNVKDNAGVSYLLADSENKIGKRYINDRGKVIRLDPVTDFQQPDGLYIRYLNLGGVDEPNTVEITYIPAAEISGVSWLHRHHREAQHDHGAILDKELQIKDKDIELKSLTVDAGIEKARIERDTTLTKSQLEDLAREAEMEKIREARLAFIEESRMKTHQMAIRDSYEMTSMARKDSSELAKYVGPIIMALVTGLGYIFARGK